MPCSGRKRIENETPPIRRSPRYGGAPCELAVLNPDQMDVSLAQQHAQPGANQRDSNLTIGSEYANKIVVKCP